MRDATEIDGDILDAARKIHNAGVQLGQGYKELLAPLNEFYMGVFQDGGGLSAVDFTTHSDPERVRTDIIALLIAAGLGDVLVQAAGRKDWKPDPHFYARYEELVESGHLTASRGRLEPSPDPLRGLRVPGPSGYGVSPGGKVI